jgi:hypothetical protein
MLARTLFDTRQGDTYAGSFGEEYRMVVDSQEIDATIEDAISQTADVMDWLDAEDRERITSLMVNDILDEEGQYMGLYEVWASWWNKPHCVGAVYQRVL